VTRLGDVARVVEAANDRRRMFRGNGKDQIGLAITRQSQANDLAISEGVREAMEDVRGGLPQAPPSSWLPTSRSSPRRRSTRSTSPSASRWRWSGW
jgi:hypothetical protein